MMRLCYFRAAFCWLSIAKKLHEILKILKSSAFEVFNNQNSTKIEGKKYQVISTHGSRR
jgi:hypothetical protein